MKEEDIKCLVCGEPFEKHPLFGMYAYEDRPIQITYRVMESAMYGFVHLRCVNEFKKRWKDENRPAED